PERAEQQLVVRPDETFEPSLVVQVAGREIEHERTKAVCDAGESDQRLPAEPLPDAAQEIIDKEPTQRLGDIHAGILLGLPDQVAHLGLALGDDPCEVVERAHRPLLSIARSSRSSRSRSSRFSSTSWPSRARELSAGSCSHQSMPIERAVSAEA